MILSLFTVSIWLVGVIIGLIPTLIDGMQSPLQARLNLGSGRIAWHGRLFYASWLFAMPLAGWLIDTWPQFQRDVLFYSLIALILGLAWLALTRSLTTLLLNALLIGIAYSMVATSAVRVMTFAFLPADHVNPASGLNIGFIGVGLGALLGPWIVAAIERWRGYRQGLLYISIALLIPAALIALRERSLFAHGMSPDLGFEVALADPYLAILAAVILAYFAVENFLEMWPEKYLQELGYRERGLRAGMTLFWLVFIGARAAAAWWLIEHPHHATALALLLVVVSSMVLGNLVSGYEFGSGSFGFLSLAACYGPLLPTLLAVAIHGDGQPIPTSVLGMLLALSGLDTLIVRPLMNAISHRPARMVMRVPTVLSLLMGAPLVLVLFLRR